MSIHPDFVEPRTSPFLLIVSLALVLGLGALGYGFGVTGWESAQVAYGAPTYASTKGEVSKATTRKEGNNTLPDVHFTYHAGGKRFEADNRHTAIGFRDGKLASKASQQWRVGQSVTIYYDAETPRRAALTRKVPWNNALMRLGFSLGAFLAVIAVVVGLLRTQKRLRARAYSKFLHEQRHPKNR